MSIETDYTVTEEMQAILKQAAGGEIICIISGTENFDVGNELRELGWVETSEVSRIVGGGMLFTIIGLTAQGRLVLNAVKREQESRRFKSRMKRWSAGFFKWTLSKVDRVILTLLCGETVLRWVLKFFGN